MHTTSNIRVMVMILLGLGLLALASMWVLSLNQVSWGNLRVFEGEHVSDMRLCHVLESVWGVEEWGGGYRSKETTSRGDEKSTIVVESKYAAVPQPSTSNENEIGFGETLSFVTSFPGTTTSDVFLSLASSADVGVFRSNPVLFPFSPASGAISSLRKEDSLEERWWDFERSLKRRKIGSTAPFPHDKLTMEASEGVAVSWNALQQAFPMARFVMIVPRTIEGARLWWNGLVGWLEREEWCGNGGEVSTRVKMALRAYIAPVAAMKEENLLKFAKKGEESDEDVKTWIEGVWRFFGGNGDAVKVQPWKKACMSSQWGVWKEDQSGALQAAVDDVFGGEGSVDAKVVWIAAGVWHAKTAQKVFSERKVGRKDALWLIDVEYLRSPSLPAQFCTFFNIQPCPLANMNILPFTPRDPEELSPEVMQKAEEQDPEAAAICRRNGGSPALRSPFLVTPSKLPQFPTPPKDGKLHVAVTFLESHPDARLVSCISGLAMVESLRIHNPSYHLTFIMFYTAETLSESLQDLLRRNKVFPIHLTVPSGTKPTLIQTLYITRMNLLALESFDRVVQVDTDLYFHQDPNYFFFTPDSEHVTPFSSALLPFFPQGSPPDPPITPIRIAPYMPTRTSMQVPVPPSRWFWVSDEPNEGLYPLAETAGIGGSNGQDGVIRGVNGGVYVATPHRRSLIDALDAFTSFRAKWESMIDGEKKTNGAGYLGDLGWYQFGPLVGYWSGLSATSPEAWDAFQRCYSFPGERVPLGPFKFTFVTKEQGVLFYVLFLLRRGRVLRWKPEGIGALDIGANIIQHFAGIHKPWKAPAATRFPPNAFRIARPLMEIALRKDENGEGLWSGLDHAYSELQSAWSDGRLVKGIGIVDDEAQKTTPNPLFADKYWEMEDNMRGDVDWMAALDAAMEQLEHDVALPPRRIPMAMQMATAWFVCSKLTSSSPPTPTPLYTLLSDPSSTPATLAPRLVQALFPNVKPNSLPSEEDLFQAHQQLDTQINECLRKSHVPRNRKQK